MTSMVIIINAVQSGKKKEFIIGDDTEQAKFLEVSRIPIDEIDLSPLKQCANLYDISIHHTNITKLDLSPLNSCTELKFVNFMKNNLEALDLSPLAACQKLEELYLSGNPINTLDLSSLERCPQLSRLYIGKLNISKVDLAPLAQCKALRELSLIENPFTSKVDITPISDLPLQEFVIEPKFVKFTGSEEKKQQLLKLIKRSNAKGF